jgi:hypothetical protein
MKYVCPECGYNAGENGEKILQLHMSTGHLAKSQNLTPEQLAIVSRENEIINARIILVLGGLMALLGLGLVAYGYGTYATLTCRFPSPCFISNSLIDQIRTAGLASVYIGSQQTVYGGLLLCTIGSMGVAYWPAKRLPPATRLQLVLLVGIFLLVLVTALAIAGGIMSFGQRINPPT